MSGGKIRTTATRLETDFVFFHREPQGLRQPHYTDPIAKRFAMTAKEFFAFIPPVNNHISIPAASWHPGVTAPTASDIGIFHTLAFAAATDDEAHYTILVPFRMEAGTCITAGIDWAYAGAPDAGTVCWNFEYKCIDAGETLVGGTTTITETTAGTHTSGQLVRTEFATQIAGCESHDVAGLHLFRDVSEDTLATDAELVAVHLEFVRDKHGEPR